MGWRRGAGDEAGDESDPDFGPPRRDARHEDESDDDHGSPGKVDHGSPRKEGSSGTNGGLRDERLVGFAAGGKWETRPPSAELADVLESLSGREWRCLNADYGEMVGMVSRWAALESWAGAAKLGVIRELIRREGKPWRPTDQHVDVPDAWSESLTHELAQALAASAGSTDRAEWLAWELGTRLPGIDALLTDGTLTYGKTRAIDEAFKHLSDTDAAHAEALIIGQLAGKSHMQVLRLATMAASKVDPDGDERRRKKAEKTTARVRLWREQSGALALAGFDLPTDEALAAHANVSARAEHYKGSGVFPKAKMDQLRAMAYLDLLNGITAETRIANAHTRADSADSADPAGPASSADAPNSAAAEGAPGGAPEAGSDIDGDDDSGGDDDNDNDGPDNGRGPDDDGDPGSDGPGSDGPDSDGPDSDKPVGPSPSPPAATRPRTDLVIPLATLLGLGNRPGEGHGLGPLDPALCRDLAAIAANSPLTEFCVTVTDLDGIAIGHGCARTRSPRYAAVTALVALPARVNLTIRRTDLQSLTDAASRGSPWAFVPRDDDHGPPGGYGTWTLTIPGGREFAVRLERVPTFECDHAHESHAYQANDTLRHLVQVRDGDCTFPPCTRHARECDFEHAIPYHKGGRTCACNAGARSRKCHRIKQSPGWNVTQPKPGFHQWTTPSGRTYTQEPKRYPALWSRWLSTTRARRTAGVTSSESGAPCAPARRSRAAQARRPAREAGPPAPWPARP
jgi:hypothetical protein